MTKVIFLGLPFLLLLLSHLTPVLNSRQKTGFLMHIDYIIILSISPYLSYTTPRIISITSVYLQSYGSLVVLSFFLFLVIFTLERIKAYKTSFLQTYPIFSVLFCSFLTVFFNYSLSLIHQVIGGELQDRLIPIPYSKSTTDQAVREF